VAEQLVLENLLEQRRAVEREEGPLDRSLLLCSARATALAVPDSPRMTRCRRWCDGVDDLVDAAHDLRLPDELAVVGDPSRRDVSSRFFLDLNFSRALESTRGG
jgi:hypothetical protein